MIYKANRIKELPKHFRLREDLKSRMKNLQVGARFLTSRQIMSEYSLSPATVSRAMKDLVKEGLLERKVGGGTFIKSLPRLNLKDETNGIASNTMLFILGMSTDYWIRTRPLNWFIRDEIQRGIINSYNGPVRLVDSTNLIDEFEKWDGAKAIIINNPSDKQEKRIRVTEAPFVIIDHSRKNFKLESNVVSWEQMSGIYRMMTYLIKVLGHKRIGLISVNSGLHAERIASYEICLKVHGLTYDIKLVENVEHSRGSEQDGYKAMTKLLKRNKKYLPTAVFVDTDMKAFGAIKAAKDFGLKVPEDISITGFDDMPLAKDSSPPLTTVKVPNFELGREAVRLLERHLNGEKIDRGVFLHSELIIRNSCAENK